MHSYDQPHIRHIHIMLLKEVLIKQTLDVSRRREIRMLLDHLELPSPELLGPGINDDAAETELGGQLKGEITSATRNIKKDSRFEILYNF